MFRASLELPLILGTSTALAAPARAQLCPQEEAEEYFSVGAQQYDDFGSGVAARGGPFAVGPRAGSSKASPRAGSSCSMR